MTHKLKSMTHDHKVIHMHCIYDCPLYSGCPPLKLILYNQSQVQEAINGLSAFEQCTRVLSFTSAFDKHTKISLLPLST